ncbi:MAG: hypothetical protein HRU19_31380 [Pseudobacteriovorax sp.]|nr:hypothetical protein [Pseudobacteriovorax sp.]
MMTVDRIRIIVLILLSLNLNPRAWADENGCRNKDYIFYRCDGIGAHAFYTPQALVLESGLEATYYRRIDKYPYATGFENVFWSLNHTDKTIRTYGGYQKFFEDQFLPRENGAFAPNYGWHLWGGGFRARLLEEYFDSKGVEYSRTLSWLTLYVGHLGNEAAQAEKADNGSVDALADLLFFDWVGKLLFLNDDFARFTAERLHLKDWTYQLSYDPVNHRLVNNGQQYWMRVPITDHFSLSLLTGNIHNSLVFTLNDQYDRQLSLGLGIKPEAISWTDDQPQSNSMSYSIMLAYSENDNPIVTAFFQNGTDAIQMGSGASIVNDDISGSQKIIVNLYPKWISVRNELIGITAGSVYGSYFLGFTSTYLPFGLNAHSRSHARFRDDP